MKRVFLDTSALVALAFAEDEHERVSQVLGAAETVFASTLLEAEFTAALAREGVEGGDRILAGISWVAPDRRLTGELERVLARGSLRGADAWHLATALYLTVHSSDTPFVTLDRRQREVAEALGFPVLP